MKDVFILDYLRLPSGKKNGIYRLIPPENFAAYLLAELVNKNPPPNKLLDQVFLSTAVGTGGNMARYISLAAGIPENVPAVTIDAQCVGSYEAIRSGFAQIKSGMADLVIVGGFESSSLLPERKFNAQDPRSSSSPYLYADFAPKSFGENSLLKTAEYAAKKYRLSKSEMVDWSILSNARAKFSVKKGQLDQVILSYGKSNVDETFKNTDLLERFKNKPALIDASTSCLFDDGAAVLLLASKKGCELVERKPEFKVLNTSTVGVHPNETPLAFLNAITKSNSQLNINHGNIDLFEINESFALKPLLLSKLHKVSADKINLLGGNLAFGHPFGASGAINLIHLLVSLQIHKKELGVVAASAAGGIGSSIAVQQIN